MTKDEVLAHVLQSKSLPTLSTVASKLISITGKEETTLNDIAALVAQDISLSAKVLKVVNSAFYTFPNEVSTIQQAVAILGTNAVRSLVLSFSFLSMERSRKDGGFEYERFWEESLATAVAAKMILQNISSTIDPEEVFTVCLLQNIGVLILAQAFPEDYDSLNRRLASEKVSLVELETSQIGAAHPLVGCSVAEHWNFPANLSCPILYHHDPESYRGGDPELAKVIQVAYLAGVVARILYSSRPLDFAEEFRQRSGELLGLSGADVDRILENVCREMNQAAEYFELKVGQNSSVPEILQKANIELSLLNLSYEQVNRELVEAKIELERLNTELLQKNRFLESIAKRDGLTEVYNHRYFQETLERESNRALRTGRPLSLIVIDLDKFKGINDSYGHQAGDFVLREACRLWSGLLRDYDLLARYGGEEFMVLLPETAADEALAVAEKLRRATDDHVFRQQKQVYAVTASFGVATWLQENEAMTRDLLIQQADEAMYEAKRHGRNRVEAYAPKKEKWYRKIKLSG